jgi:protein TonB
MRTWTLALSVCAHTVAIGALVVAPMFATADLPEPRRPITVETFTPIDIPRAPLASQQRPGQPSVALSDPIGVVPYEIVPEPTVATADISIDPGAVAGGFPPSDLVIGGEPISAPPPPPRQVAPVRVSALTQPKRVVYVQPTYPPLAIASKTEGVVILEAVIDERGDVREARVLRGHPLLNDAAVQAVTQWRFTPTLLGGTPVPIVMTVTVGFQ